MKTNQKKRRAEKKASGLNCCLSKCFQTRIYKCFFFLPHQTNRCQRFPTTTTSYIFSNFFFHPSFSSSIPFPKLHLAELRCCVSTFVFFCLLFSAWQRFLLLSSEKQGGRKKRLETRPRNSSWMSLTYRVFLDYNQDQKKKKQRNKAVNNLIKQSERKVIATATVATISISSPQIFSLPKIRKIKIDIKLPGETQSWISGSNSSSSASQLVIRFSSEEKRVVADKLN